MGLVPLSEEIQGFACSLLSIMWGHSKEKAICNPSSGFLQAQNLQAAHEKQFLLSQPVCGIFLLEQSWTKCILSRRKKMNHRKECGNFNDASQPKGRSSSSWYQMSCIWESDLDGSLLAFIFFQELDAVASISVPSFHLLQNCPSWNPDLTFLLWIKSCYFHILNP